MKVKALFSRLSTECCLVTTEHGYTFRTLFENVSSLVNHCTELSIPLRVSDCTVSDDFLS